MGVREGKAGDNNVLLASVPSPQGHVDAVPGGTMTAAKIPGGTITAAKIWPRGPAALAARPKEGSRESPSRRRRSDNARQEVVGRQGKAVSMPTR